MPDGSLSMSTWSKAVWSKAARWITPRYTHTHTHVCTWYVRACGYGRTRCVYVCECVVNKGMRIR